MAVNQWLGDKQRFADLFNGYIFGGELIVKPEDLQALDRESDIVVKDKKRKKKSYQRYRDIIMEWKENATLAILACETQDKVHYGMPVRNMLYDALTYNEQMKEKWSEYNRGRRLEVGENVKDREAEYLSRFEKGGKIQPVITLVFYYGDKEWDGSRDLYGLFGWDKADDTYRIFEKYVPNYRINLINPNEIKDLSVFCKDLQIIFKMLQYKNNKDNMLHFINDNKEYFSSVSTETYNIVRVMFDLKKVFEDREDCSEKEEYDMCKAFEDWYAESVQLGREEGIKQGIEEGREQGIKQGMARALLNNIEKIMSKEYSLQEACELVGTTVEEYEAAEKLMKVELLKA